MTPTQMRIAADMCDKRGFTMNKDTTDDEEVAAAFLFDNGIFFGGPKGCDMAAKELRKRADEMDAEK